MGPVICFNKIPFYSIVYNEKVGDCRLMPTQLYHGENKLISMSS